MDILSSSVACTVINKHAKGAVVQISTVCNLIYHVASQRVLKNCTF